MKKIHEYTSDRVFEGIRTLSEDAAKAFRERLKRALKRMDNGTG